MNISNDIIEKLVDKIYFEIYIKYFSYPENPQIASKLLENANNFYFLKNII